MAAGSERKQLLTFHDNNDNYKNVFFYKNIPYTGIGPCLNKKLRIFLRLQIISFQRKEISSFQKARLRKFRGLKFKISWRLETENLLKVRSSYKKTVKRRKRQTR